MRYMLFFLFLLAVAAACGSSGEAQEITQPSEKIASATTLEYATDSKEKVDNGDSAKPPLFDGLALRNSNTTNNSTSTTNDDSTETETSQPQTTLTTTTQSVSTAKATTTTDPKPLTTKPTPTVKPVHIELELLDCRAVPVNLSREEFLEKLYWHCLSRSRQLGQVTDKDWQDWMSRLVADDSPEFRKKTRDTSFYKSPEALCLDFDDRPNCGNSPLPAISVPANVAYGCKKTGDTILYIGKRRVERILHVCGESYPVRHGKN